AGAASTVQRTSTSAGGIASTIRRRIARRRRRTSVSNVTRTRSATQVPYRRAPRALAGGGLSRARRVRGRREPPVVARGLRETGGCDLHAVQPTAAGASQPAER